LLNIEGLGRQLYPQLDLWATAKPFLEDLVKEKYSMQSTIKKLQEKMRFPLKISQTSAHIFYQSPAQKHAHRYLCLPSPIQYRP
jgi:predicted unusual protein kinase regulating ubiquinone biosynthesis (AarF/ABC1/UbiB family)